MSANRILEKDDKDIFTLAMAKKEHRYVFIFKEESKADVLRTLGRFATNPDLEFTWHDAAALSQRIRLAFGAGSDAGIME